MSQSNLKYAIFEFLTIPFTVIGYMIFIIGFSAIVLSTIVLMTGSSIVEYIKLFLDGIQKHG